MSHLGRARHANECSSSSRSQTGSESVNRSYLGHSGDLFVWAQVEALRRRWYSIGCMCCPYIFFFIFRYQNQRLVYESVVVVIHIRQWDAGECKPYRNISLRSRYAPQRRYTCDRSRQVECRSPRGDFGLDGCRVDLSDSSDKTHTFSRRSRRAYKMCTICLVHRLRRAHERDVGTHLVALSHVKIGKSGHPGFPCDEVLDIDGRSRCAFNKLSHSFLCALSTGNETICHWLLAALSGYEAGVLIDQ